MMHDVWVAAALRTPVAKHNGALAHLQAWELASAVIEQLLSVSNLSTSDIDHVIMGNALYGGGNPARLAALHAGIPQTVPALTIDSQCCGGMDSISLGTHLIQTGKAQAVIVGGLESWSRAPQRTSNPVEGQGQIYHRPPFSPWPENDPEMLAAAAELAAIRGIDRKQQQEFAINSHAKALHQSKPLEMVSVAGLGRDEYTRPLNTRLCQRLPSVAGNRPFELTAATVAPQADAAALLLLCSDHMFQRMPATSPPVRVLATRSGGADPSQPALAPIAVARQLMQDQKVDPGNLHNVQLMEAFAVQAIAFIEDLNLDPSKCNPSGGALSRGHPIGASGAIEATNAYHALQYAPGPSLALCAIAAAGGLGSAMILERT